MSQTHELVLTITHPSGLHLRPAAMFVKTATRFQSQLTITNLTRNSKAQVDAKSMFGVMQIGVSQGHTVQLSAQGPDAAEALATLERLVLNNFEVDR